MSYLTNPYRYEVAGCFFTSDFTSDNWSDVGNQSANGGDDYTSTSINDFQELRTTSNSGVGENGGAVGITQMSEGLGTSWNIRFNYTTVGSMTSNGNNYLFFGVTSDSSYTTSQGADTDQSGDACLLMWHFDTPDKRITARTWNDGIQRNSPVASTVAWVDDTTYYWQLTYDNTDFTCTRFDSTYTTPSITATIDNAGLTGMDYLLVGTHYGQGTGVWTIDINEIKVANDTTDAC